MLYNRDTFSRIFLLGLVVALAPLLANAAPGTGDKPPAQQAPAAASSAPAFVPPRAVPSTVMKNWPVYTAEARQAHREGVVLLAVKISATGDPVDVRLARSSGYEDLDLAAVAAVRNWKFTPATKDGVAVETTVNLPVNFSLKQAENAPTSQAGAPVQTPAKQENAKPPQQKPKPKAKKPVAKPKPAKPQEETAPAPASESQQPAAQ